MNPIFKPSQPTPQQRRRVRLLVGVALASLTLFLLMGPQQFVYWQSPQSRAQVVIRPGRIQIVADEIFIPANAVGRRGAQETDNQGVAPLKTDPDLEAILEKANRFVADQNYSVAAQLWQAVLEKCGDTLYSEDEITYYSMIDQVEGILSRLPTEALRVYRISADAEARQILARAASGDDLSALSEVVRRYFISSVGDDAAFRLASILMDRHDFVGALRLLEKVRDYHPDPSMPQAELLSRIALCHLLVGDYNEGVRLIAELKSQGTAGQDIAAGLSSLLALTNDDLNEKFQLTSLNSFRNYRVQPNVPEGFLKGNLIGAWQFYHDIVNDGPFRYPDIKGNVVRRTETDIEAIGDTVSQRERALALAWEQFKWRPTAGLLVADGQLFFKTVANLSSWPTTLAEQPNWRSVWLNQFEIDDATRAMEQIRNSYGNQPGFERAVEGFRLPSSVREIQFFGDRVPFQMAKIGNTIYSLEGKNYEAAENPQSDAARRRGLQYNAVFRRTRTNFLVAYESDTGRVKWTLPKNSGLSFRSAVDRREPEKPDGNEAVENPEVAGAAAAGETEPWLTSGGFMGAPIAYGKSLLVPVNIGGAVYVYALDPANEGKTLWRTYLCDEPETSAAPWAPISLTMEGTDLFAASGMGVVFVLDPANGAIRFAQRYQRGGERNQALANFGWQINRMDFDGWEEDIIIPYGRQMICFCSDSRHIFALDRSNAEKIWEVDFRRLDYSIDYLIGIQNDVLYAGGRKTIIAFDLQGDGRMIWEAEQHFDGGASLGRAMLCANGLYVPLNDTIIRFDISEPLQEPRVAQIAHVNLGNFGQVGNLYSDGQRIWIQGLNRLIGTAAVGEPEEGSNPQAPHPPTNQP